MSQSSPSPHEILHQEITELTTFTFEKEVLEADQVFCFGSLIVLLVSAPFIKVVFLYKISQINVSAYERKFSSFSYKSPVSDFSLIRTIYMKVQ